jgi:hypothetical protein
MDPLDAAADHVRGAPGGRYPLRRRSRTTISGASAGGTPTLFIDGVVHRGAYDPESLREALRSSSS